MVEMKIRSLPRNSLLLEFFQRDTTPNAPAPRSFTFSQAPTDCIAAESLLWYPERFQRRLTKRNRAQDSQPHTSKRQIKILSNSTTNPAVQSNLKNTRQQRDKLNFYSISSKHFLKRLRKQKIGPPQKWSFDNK